MRAGLRELRGRRALVTGGSSGIGKAVAAALARRGASVAIAARDPARLAAAEREISAAATGGAAVHAVPMDVADAASTARGTQQAIDALGGLDLLVANAGIPCAKRFEDIPDAEFERVMAVNFFGVVHATRAALPALKAQRSGHVAIVSSLAGLIAIYGYTAYSPSKFALTGFAEALRQELVPFGIGVSVLYPPDVDTPQLAEENRTKPPETRAIAGNARMMMADTVAEALLRGVASGRFRIIPGLEGRAADLASRLAPGLVRWIVDRQLTRART
jgi:3-dehydrosphinganine reductase